MGRPEKFATLRKFFEEKASELRRNSRHSFSMSFAEIENLGVHLPPSASKHRAWWANSYYISAGDLVIPNSIPGAKKKPWERAGFRTEKVDMKQGALTFRYLGNGGERGIVRPPLLRSPSHQGMAETSRPYSEPEKTPPGTPPRCRHPLYGALKGHIRLVAGTDLTEPADPEWGERVWGEDKK